MIRHYLTVALRGILGHKLFSIINIAGLSVGIVSFLLIMLFVRHELSYENTFSQSDRIYRLSLDVIPPDGAASIHLAANSPQIAPLLQEEQAQIEAATRLVSLPIQVLSGDDVTLQQLAGLVDSNFFEVFDFVWLAGDPSHALSQPDSVVLTHSAAQKLFGFAQALGQTVQLDSGNTVRVSGVIADLPANTHLSFELLLPITLSTSVYGPNVFNNWSGQYFHTYLLMQEGADINELTAQLPDFVERHVGEGISQVLVHTATPIKNIHLHSSRRNEMKVPGSFNSVLAFIAIAVVVLLVACMNFMNLATVRATQRAQEVGVRKAIGASRRQLIVQFLGEVMLLVVLAGMIGVMGTEVALPFFNSLVQQSLELGIISSLGILLAVMVAVAFIAGSYPAFYLSSFNASTVLRGKSGTAARGLWFRKVLVVFQFSISVALLIATWVIHTQNEFARNIDAGYEKSGVVVLKNTGPEGVGHDWDTFKQLLLANPDVLAVTASNSLASMQVGSNYYFNYEGGTQRRSMPTMLVDFDYFKAYGISLLAGRVFSREFGSDLRNDLQQDNASYILNAMAARELGWSPEEALGKQVEVVGMGAGTVVGVVNDVRYGSVQQPVEPVTYMIPPEPTVRIHSETRLGLAFASIKLSGRNELATLAHIDNVWRQFHSRQPVSLTYLEDELAGLYGNEQRQGRLLASFAVLSIIITTMGLYGLSSYNAQLRTKEIGVRKVMGGSVMQIVMLLTRDFSKLVLFSNLIAWPVSYSAMNRWLENFAYRIDLSPLIFIGSGAIALCIAWVTVGGTAAKAASQKPVLALRYE